MPKNEDRSWGAATFLGLAMAITGLWRFVRHRPVESSGPKKPVNDDVMYEARDVDASILGWVAIGLIVSAFVISFFVKLSHSYFTRTEFGSKQPVTLVKEVPRRPALPALQVSPPEELQQLRKAEEQVLNSYGWVDRKAGVVRIPVDEAMKKVLEKGLPPRENRSQATDK